MGETLQIVTLVSVVLGTLANIGVMMKYFIQNEHRFTTIEGRQEAQNERIGRVETDVREVRADVKKVEQKQLTALPGL